MKNHAEVLMKFIAGYPGLNLTEANVLAYIERFSHLSLHVFEAALHDAARKNPSFFPTVPQVEAASEAVKIGPVMNHAAYLPAPDPRREISSGPVPWAKQGKGWLFKLYLDKCAEVKAKRKAHES